MILLLMFASPLGIREIRKSVRRSCGTLTPNGLAYLDFMILLPIL